MASKSSRVRRRPPKPSSSPLCQDAPNPPNAAVVQGPPFLEKGIPTCVFNVKGKITAEMGILVYSCEYVGICSLRENWIYLFRIQACDFCLHSLNRAGKMAAFEGLLENFKPADPFWRSSSGVPSRRQTWTYWSETSKEPQR